MIVSVKRDRENSNDHDHVSRPRLKALARFELRQRNAFTAVFEDHFHGHVDVDLFDGATDDVAAKSRPIVEVDPGRDVRNIRREAAQRLADDFAYHGEGKNSAPAADLYPFEFVAGAIAANRPGTKDPCAAIFALLHQELAGFGALPKRLIDGSDFRKWFANLLLLPCYSTFPY